MEETWKIIAEFPKYEVSTFGRIKNIQTGRIRKPQLNRDGYFYMHLMITNVKTRNIKVHRMVADTFLPKIDGKRFVDHIDGVKTNNSLSNLRWCSFQENIDFAWELGTYNNRGENHGMSKLKINDVIDIKIMQKAGVYTGRFISDIFGVNECCISDIKQGRTWMHVNI